MGDGNLISNYINAEVLHTKSDFLLKKDFNLNVLDNAPDLSTAIQEAEDIEQSMYNKFGKNNFTDFMQMIRQGFYQHQSDREVLSNFKYEQLTSSLRTLAQQQQRQLHNPQDYEITIEINDFATDDVKKLFSKLFNGQVNSPIQTTIDNPNIQKLFNKITEHRRKTSSVSKKRLNEIEQIEKGLYDCIKISTKEISTSTQYNYSRVIKEDKKEAAFPWGYTKSEIEEALNDPVQKSRLQQAFDIVRDYVCNTLGNGATAQLKAAIIKVWNNKIGPNLSQDFSFFERGMSTESLKGALGEFQTAVIFEYFNALYGTSSATKIASIEGDTETTAGLADVKIFDSIGIQVKNFATSWRKSGDIDTTTSVGQISDYFSSSTVARDFRIFFANYFFNKSFQQKRIAEYNNLSLQIAQLQYALISLSTAQNREKSAFYMIGGQYLVPGSSILKAIQQNSSLFNSKGTPVYSKKNYGKTDEAYNDSKTNLYAIYWDSLQASDGRTYFKPNETNQSEYANLVYKNIHVNSSFDYQKIIGNLNTSAYSLW